MQGPIALNWKIRKYILKAIQLLGAISCVFIPDAFIRALIISALLYISSFEECKYQLFELALFVGIIGSTVYAHFRWHDKSSLETLPHMLYLIYVVLIRKHIPKLLENPIEDRNI